MKVPINVKAEEAIKNESKIIFEQLGMDMSTAINMFLKFVCRKKALPYEIVELPNEDFKNNLITNIGIALETSQKQIAEGKTYDLFKEMDKIKEQYGFN